MEPMIMIPEGNPVQWI